MDAADTALMIQVLERLLSDDSFLDNEIKKEIKQYDNDGDYKIDREEFHVGLYLELISIATTAIQFLYQNSGWSLQ